METPLGENNDACWRAASRASRRHYFPGRGQGLSPRPPEASSLPSLKDKVQLFLERIQIPRGPGAGFGVAGFEHVPDELGVFVKALRRSRMGSRKAFMDSTRSFLQSSATSDSCVNVKKQRGRMPPAARAEPLWKPLGKTMTPVGARLRAPAGVVFSDRGRGAEPPRPPEASFLPSLKDKVQLFLERIQIPRGPGAGFGVAGFEHVPDELGVFVKALRRSRMGSRKAFMDSTRSFLQSSATSDSCVNVKKQRGRMPPAARG